MSILEPKNTSKRFINVLASDGTFREVVDKNTEGAKMREWEAKDGTTGVKYELVYETAKGKIDNIRFKDGDYGEQILITLKSEDENEEPVTISLATNQPFGEDFMKKLPNIKLDKDVIFRPFNFEDETGKNRRGLAITQEENGEQVKVDNYYYDKETKEATNGYPKPAGDEKTSDDWRVYFINARKFLIAETKKRLETSFSFPEKPTEEVKGGEIQVEDIPF